ncbi:MAG: type II secretion system protein [Candidatus Hydrogenedentota bacterium]
MKNNVYSGSSGCGAEAGFTLLEVMIALGILGSAMFMLMESQYGTLVLFSDTQDAALMEILAQQGTALAEAEILMGEENGSGDFGESYPDFGYEYDAILLDENQLPGLLEVTFSIHGPVETNEFVFRVYDGVQTDVE